MLTIDFVGWSDSTKPPPAAYNYSHTTWTEELEAVVKHLQLQSVVIVVHDASGPTGIDFAIADSERPPSERIVKGLVVLNSYYNWDSAFVKPEAIFLFSTPSTRHVAAWANKTFPAFRRAVFRWQVSRWVLVGAAAAAWRGSCVCIAAQGTNQGWSPDGICSLHGCLLFAVL